MQEFINSIQKHATGSDMFWENHERFVPGNLESSRYRFGAHSLPNMITLGMDFI